MLNLTDSEKRDVVKRLDKNEPLPEKYRFLLFDDKKEVELVWNGKTNEVTNTVLPFQTIEHIDEPRSEEKIEAQRTLFDTSGRQIKGWTNKLIWGDNKLILSSLKNGPLRKEIEAQGGLKLIYIDPPFDVGADFSMDIKIGEEEFTKKPSVIEEIAYRDTWGKGADSFIAMIYERLKLMHSLLAEDGSIYVHCDWRVNSYMRLVLDEVFGKDNFRNEIVWHYDIGTAPARDFKKKHDIIFRYSKSNNYFYNQIIIPPHNPDRYNLIDDDGRHYAVRGDTGKKVYADEGQPEDDVWTFLKTDKLRNLNSMSDERKSVGYPTQKSEFLLERIIKASSNKGDLVADFFCGSGTTMAVAEKLGRKWIGSDLGRFSIHTTRKRMIGVQRELKKDGKDFRAFEILNIGRYEREHFVDINENLREEEKRKQREKKEKEFIDLILAAYKAQLVDSFNNFVGKKQDRLVAIGPIENPVTQEFVNEAIKECKQKSIFKFDVLGFDYEMGLDFSKLSKQGVQARFRIIPREVFDKRAVEKGQVKFYDVAYIDIKPIIRPSNSSLIRGVRGVKEIAIELTDFSVFYNQDNTGEVEEKLRPGGSKVVIRNGQVIKISKNKESDIIEEEILTKKWTDWVDYWAVDFDFESKKEIIKVIDEKTGEENSDWTGNYIFENEWQSFRTKKDRKLELISAFKQVSKGKRKIAVKVVDIFGNDTTKVVEVNV